MTLGAKENLLTKQSGIEFKAIKKLAMDCRVAFMKRSILTGNSHSCGSTVPLKNNYTAIPVQIFYY